MSRRLLLEEDLGSTSACSSQPDKPAAESGEAQNTTSVRSQRGNCAKVRHHKLYEPETTCGAAKLRKPSKEQWRVSCARRITKLTQI